MIPPDERYLRDAQFKMLVDTMEAYIHQCQFTPSELREAAILAATRYEMHRTHYRHEGPPFHMLGLKAKEAKKGENDE